MRVVNWGIVSVCMVGDRLEIPVSSEVFAKDGIVWFANFAMLQGGQEMSYENDWRLTTNLRSFVKVKRTTASILSKASSESLILYLDEPQSQSKTKTYAANISGLSRY